LNTVVSSRIERRRLQTRQRLLEAAQLILAERGYHKFTIQAVTDRADVGYGTFYLYFEDKDVLVWQVLYTYGEGLRQEIDQRLALIPFPMREYLSWIAIFRYMHHQRESFSAMFGRQGSAKLTQYYQTYLAEIHEENLRLGRYQAGVDLPPTFLAQFMAGAMLRLLIWWIESDNTYTAEQMAEMLYQAVYREPPPADPPIGFWDDLI
jgi:AcrR family transcriptional regulator